MEFTPIFNNGDSPVETQNLASLVHAIAIQKAIIR